MNSGVRYLSSKGDTGISGWINQNSNLIIDKIISEHPAVSFLEEEGYPTSKNMFTKCEIILFFEDPTTISPEIFRRTRNGVSTDKLLAEIIRSSLPKIKLELKNKKDNSPTTISAQFTIQTVKIIGKIISSSKFKNSLQLSEEGILADNQKTPITMAHLIRAAQCNSLRKLNYLKENPHIYERATTLQSCENILKKIYDEKYKEAKN